MPFNRRGNHKEKGENNRLNFIMAVVFLLAAAIIYRLVYLQVVENDLYVALASDQHQIFNVLEPKRGAIYLQDTPDGGNEKLYPVATNKEFALIYAVPSKIKNAEETAGKLYELFDQTKIAAEVDRLLDADPVFAPVKNPETGETVIDPEKEEFRKIKREAEIEARKQAAINEYLAKLAKPSDPYEPIKAKVDEAQLKTLLDWKTEGLDFIMQNHRYYPEKDMGGQLLGFVGFKEGLASGQYGLEGFFDRELSGVRGSIKAERSANGKLVIINDREYRQADDGSDLVLTINRSIQFYACSKLSEAVMRHGADSGSVVIIEPDTGAIMAMCSHPDYDPNNYSEEKNINVFNNPSIFDQYEPGSIFKVFTMAAGLDQGKVSPDTTYEDKGAVKIEGWSGLIKNSDYDQKGGHGVVDMNAVLELSLNTGVIFVMQKTGPEVFAEYVKNFGFGEKTGIELETEGDGNISTVNGKNIRPIEAATATFGQGLTVTPLQMAMAYAAIANDGVLMKPYVVKEIKKSNGEVATTQPQIVRRVISSRTAALLGAMMVNVVEKGHGTKAGVKGYYIGGKTGTAQVPKKGGGYEANAHIGSFAGFGPVENPRFVMLVKINNPRDVMWAESSAAPLFGDIAQFILNYYQVPKER